MDNKLFEYATIKVIDKLEGGYFHPDMRTNNPGKFGSYHRSGETMFGLDRHAGHGLYYSTPKSPKNIGVIDNLPNYYNGKYKFKNTASQNFWTLIDNANARKNWKWLFKGGSLEDRLKKLVVKIMLPHYISLRDRYLSEKSIKIIEKDEKLLFHFIYASWNGSGWFQTFAKKFNSAVEKGSSKKELLNVALDSRINSSNKLISRGGKKIQKFINEIEYKKPKKIFKKVIILTSVVALGIFAYKKFYK